MEDHICKNRSVTEDHRFKIALDHFNSEEWYLAHDSFEELWHESNISERNTLQGILQISVAQLHLESQNKNGATILFGEALGRLSRIGTCDLGLDLDRLRKCIEQRLTFLHLERDVDLCTVPFLLKKDIGAF